MRARTRGGSTVRGTFAENMVFGVICPKRRRPPELHVTACHDFVPLHLVSEHGDYAMTSPYEPYSDAMHTHGAQVRLTGFWWCGRVEVGIASRPFG